MSKKLIVCLSFLPLAANALNLQLMNHSHSPHYLVTEDTLSQNSLLNQRLIVSANYHHVNDPLVATNAQRTERTRTLIGGMTTVHLGVGIQTSSRFLVGISAPFSQVTFGETQERETGTGDTTVIGKYRVSAANNPTSIAIIPSLTLPTGDQNLFLGDGGVGGGIKLAMERDFGRFRVNGNLGILRNSSASFADINYTTRSLAALGVHYAFSDQWHLTSEAYTMMSKSKKQTPAELVTALQYYQSGALSMSAGIGFSGLDSVTGNDWRFIVGLKWQPPVGKMRMIASVSENSLSEIQKNALTKIEEINLQIRFAHDSDQLNEEGKNAIEKMAELIKNANFDDQVLIIQGHANRIGEANYNRNLSLRRAQSVRTALVQQGLSPQQIEAIGHGQAFPVEHEDQRMALDMSRRVDFLVR
jgi:outer membrane protein OmpA-like peptidoglycan-associated protein